MVQGEDGNRHKMDLEYLNLYKVNIINCVGA